MPARYTRELLAEAVAASESLSEAIRRLGGNPTDGTRSYARKLITRWGIDSSHLEREGVRHTERRLREAVNQSSSVVEVVRRLGINPVGGNQAHISRRIAALGIDTSNFSTASRGCARRQQRNWLILRTPSDGRVPGERLRKAMLSSGVAEECAMCGTGPQWQGEPLRLEVDHRNGDWWDNRLENLRILCPNCHAVTDTYRGRRRKAAT
ncbi:HNH endonuclease signature motif containing protein [Streptomyces silvisoli]|uniref:HNH endonuclease signature motif containing protein n=1 Tax=Streptomyces silvisoli TaxID=3034235 RepID=A0ABT5ZTD0_9ACTN|nr:HNH endonuclease signature motif containing protein [Streptomyces silvisoli]MDF3292911.1 HNH endonuclease signature motif containing protein [Streptomyces silvisoli]